MHLRLSNLTDAEHVSDILPQRLKRLAARRENCAGTMPKRKPAAREVHCDAGTSMLLGRPIVKEFKGFGTFRGYITDFHKETDSWPTIWFDRMCLDQTAIDESLACLPVFLAGCRRLLVIAGETYAGRLWSGSNPSNTRAQTHPFQLTRMQRRPPASFCRCVMELFTFMTFQISAARACRSEQKVDITPRRSSEMTYP